MRLSASQIKTHMACPLQAKFHYVDQLPDRQHAKATWGACLHEALADYNRHADVERAESVFKRTWHDPARIGAEIDFWPPRTDWGTLRNLGLEVLRSFDRQCRWDDRQVIAVEHPFLVPIGDHLLSGKVDLVETRLSGKGRDLIRIVDYKSSARKPFRSALYHDVQFTVYAYAATRPEFWFGVEAEDGTAVTPPVDGAEWWWEVAQTNPHRPIWFHLMRQEEIDAGPRGEEDFRRLHMVCDQIARAHETDTFVPKIGEACGLCSYTEPCGIEIPDRKQLVLEDPNAWL